MTMVWGSTKGSCGRWVQRQGSSTNLKLGGKKKAFFFFISRAANTLSIILK